MAGLLGEGWEDPRSQGLLALAGGMLQGNMGAGVSAMGATMATAKDTAMKRQYMEAQMQAQARAQERQQKEWLREDEVNALASKFYKPGQPGLPGQPAQPGTPGLQSGNQMMPSIDSMLPPEMQIGQPGRAAIAPTAPTAASFDSSGYANALMGVDPKAGMAALASIKTANAPIKLGAGESIVDPHSFKSLFTNPKEQTVPADVIKYEYAKKQGYTGSLQQFEMELKKAGAPSVSTHITNSLGGSIATQVGPMLKESYNAANGASQQMDAAVRIIKAVDNKSSAIFSGPGAGVRMTIAQMGQILGVGGADEAAKIANTRAVIRGLAEMTLAGRKQMTGQGAITESEGALAERANSGSIESLTTAEIRQLAAASARSAKFIHGAHTTNVANLLSNPETAKLAPFYKPMPFPDFNTDIPGSSPASGAKFLGFEQPSVPQ
jgi:hypothetical protein